MPMVSDEDGTIPIQALVNPEFVKRGEFSAFVRIWYDRSKRSQGYIVTSPEGIDFNGVRRIRKEHLSRMDTQGGLR